jgi:RNA 2',3'-cyclic 3'-phosphodiesterase
VTHPGRWVDPYAGVHGRRVFVAVPLGKAAADAVTAIVDAVRAQALPDGARDVRWVRLDGLHLTLRFVGPASEARIETLGRIVREAAGATSPIRATLAGAGTFPPGGRPRTLWIGVREGVTELDALARHLSDALVAEGWPADARPFRPHLTLARSDGIAVGPLVASRLAEAIADRPIECPLDRLVLFESVTGGGPARYVPIAEANLGGER